MKTTVNFLSFVFCLLSLQSWAQIIHVPADQPTIQAGINAAVNDDTVLVDPGTYFENIDFTGKAITLASQFLIDGDTSHISNTIINGSQPSNPDFGSVVAFMNGEDTTSVLCGFTITGGTGLYSPAFNDVAGGGILCLGSGAKIIHNHIEYNVINSPTISYGGGIEQWANVEGIWIVLINNRIRHNESNGITGAQGGGAEIGGNARIVGNDISHNTCTSSTGQCGGGGIFKSSLGLPAISEVEIKNNRFRNNSVNCGELAIGGALWIVEDFGKIINNDISNNVITAGTYGYSPGIALIKTDTNLVLGGNFITGNHYILGECLGGGVFVEYGKANILNNIIKENHASYGGGIFIFDTVLTFPTYPSSIINNTLVGNQATEEGGGLYIQDAKAVLLNTIFWNNTASLGPEIYDASLNLEVHYCNVKGSWPGNENIDTDPIFLDDSCHLNCGSPSPCINAGIDELEINGVIYQAPEVDFEGELRPQDGQYDIGADEEEICVGINEFYSSTRRIEIEIYPNPCTESVKIVYRIPDASTSLGTGAGYLIIEIFSIEGKKMHELVNQEVIPGEYEVEININDLPAGVYLVKLQVGGERGLRKLVISN